MKNKETMIDIRELLGNISEKEILKLRECCSDKNGFDDYMYKVSKKIFKRMLVAYLRFEVLQKCILDAKNNSEFYQNIDKKKINYIFKKLQTICLFLNAVIEKYDKLLSKIQHP